MIFLYLFLFLLMLIGLKPKFNGYNEEYISRDSTTSIKGIFVLIVFFSHFRGYSDLSGHWYNTYFGMISGWIGQLMVVMFLFYSGYGIIKQIEKSNEEYIKSFLKHRFLPVWLQFAICICLFIIVDSALGLLNNYSLSQILLAFTGWTAIGNSNWFMFVTFVLYIFVFVSFRFLKFKDIKWNVVIFTALSCVLGIALYFLKESHWWNTLLCFSLGMWFGYYKDKIDICMIQSRQYWLTCIPLLIVTVGLGVINIRLGGLGKFYIMLPILFALSIVVVTMKIKIGNKILDFFGKHIFSIYILQRIPMMIFQNIISNLYLFFIVSFIATVIVALCFDYLFNKCKRFIVEKN